MSAFPQPDKKPNPQSIGNCIWDAVIVGGGPASSAAAIKLSQAGFKVLMLEHQPGRQGYGESLPPSSVNLVQEILGGITESDYVRFGMRASPGNKSSWQSCALDTFDFYSHPTGHGLCVDRCQFDEALRTRAACAGVQVRYGTKFIGCHLSNNQWKVAVQHGDSAADSEESELTTRYLIDATGRQASVAKAIGININRSDKLCAATQTYRHSSHQSDSEFTLLEATEDGWWYSNLLPDGRHRVVAFHTDRDLPQAKFASTATGFHELLQKTQHLFPMIADHELEKYGTLKVTAAGSQRLNSFTAERFAAIGDAAQAWDPLSSHGMTKALESGVKAGQLIAYALECDEQPDLANNYLNRYGKSQEALWHQYLQQFHYFYQAQPRWQDNPFWQRRSNNLQPLEKERLAI